MAANPWLPSQDFVSQPLEVCRLPSPNPRLAVANPDDAVGARGVTMPFPGDAVTFHRDAAVFLGVAVTFLSDAVTLRSVTVPFRDDAVAFPGVAVTHRRVAMASVGSVEHFGFRISDFELGIADGGRGGSGFRFSRTGLRKKEDAGAGGLFPEVALLSAAGAVVSQPEPKRKDRDVDYRQQNQRPPGAQF
jgi:hypothetical protein